MYLHQFSFSNCDNIQVDVKFPPKVDELKVNTDQGGDFSGMYVIYGRPGEGKTAALKAIALGLIGPSRANRLAEDERLLLRRSHRHPMINVTLHYQYERATGRQHVGNDPFVFPDPGEGKNLQWVHSAGMTLHDAGWKEQPSFSAFSNPWVEDRAGSSLSKLNEFFSLSYPCRMSPIIFETSSPTIETRHPLLFSLAVNEPHGSIAPEQVIRDFLAQRTNEHPDAENVPGLVLIDDFGHSMDDESCIALSGELTAEYPKLQFIVTTECEAFKNSVPEERRFQVRRDGDLVILERP